MDGAEVLQDLHIPPGNRLKKVKGDRKGQVRIRIYNSQQICFRWLDGHAYEVAITD